MVFKLTNKKLCDQVSIVKIVTIKQLKYKLIKIEITVREINGKNRITVRRTENDVNKVSTHTG